MRREGLEHGEKGCWKGPSLQALACSAAFGVDSKNSVCVREKIETRSVWRNVFRSCSPKIPNRRNLENFPSGRRGCGERWGELPGFTTCLSKGPKFFSRKRSSAPRTGRIEVVVRRDRWRPARGSPAHQGAAANLGGEGAQGVEAASAARASFRRFIRLRMRSRLRLEIRST